MSLPCQLIHDESAFAGSIVPLLVGKSICPVYVHYRILRARSPFFEPLLADWSESDGETIVLPDVDASAFDQFLAWLYTDCIDLRRRHGEWVSLCRLWVLAARFEVPALQNRVTEAFSSRLYRQDITDLDLGVLAYVYEQTKSYALLRRVFVYIAVWFGNDDVFADVTSQLPPEFHTAYALQRAKKTRMQKEGEMQGDVWDLTNFLVKGGEVEPFAVKKGHVEERGVKKEEKGEHGVKEGDEDEKVVKKEKRDSATEERKTKRKKC